MPSEGSVAAVPLSGLVVCRDEAARIGPCLESLRFCDEIVVVDSGSTDGTLEIATRFGARVFERPFESINDQKEFGREVARGAWLLNLDADEVVTPPLQEEITRVLANGDDDGVDAYRIPFRNHFRSVWVRRSGYYPDPHVRLIRRTRARWDRSAPVHDKILVDGRTGMLRGHINHYSFESISDFIHKSNTYASSFATRAHANGRRAGFFTIAMHTLGRFLKAYVVKGGFLEGALGLTISGLQAYEVFQKYVRLWELNRFPSVEGETRRG